MVIIILPLAFSSVADVILTLRLALVAPTTALDDASVAVTVVA